MCVCVCACVCVCVCVAGAGWGVGGGGRSTRARLYAFRPVTVSVAGVLGSVLGLVCLVIDLQFLSQCGSTYTCQGRSIPGMHWHVADTVYQQQHYTD